MSIMANDPVWTHDFDDEGDAVPFRDALRHKYSINKLQRHFILLRIERGTRCWKFYVATTYSIWNILM